MQKVEIIITTSYIDTVFDVLVSFSLVEASNISITTRNILFYLSPEEYQENTKLTYWLHQAMLCYLISKYEINE